MAVAGVFANVEKHGPGGSILATALALACAAGTVALKRHGRLVIHRDRMRVRMLIGWQEVLFRDIAEVACAKTLGWQTLTISIRGRHPLILDGVRDAEAVAQELRACVREGRTRDPILSGDMLFIRLSRLMDRMERKSP
jgi:hypothetical protein